MNSKHILPGNLLFSYGGMVMYARLCDYESVSLSREPTLFVVLSSVKFLWSKNDIMLEPLYHYVLIMTSRGNIGYVTVFFVEKSELL